MMNKLLARALLGSALVVLIAVVSLWRDQFDAAALQTWVDGAGVAGPVLFIAVYAAATVFFFPGSVITLAGGVLFGPLWGTLWNLAGATLGASLAFLIARYLGADWVTRRAGPRMARLHEGVAAEGWRFIAFVRLVPLFPFNLLNYALGLTRIPFPTYAMSSAIFMLPGAVAFTWLGHMGHDALAGGDSLVRNLLIALALVAGMAILPRWVNKARAKPKIQTMPGVDVLKRQLDAHHDVLVVDVRGTAEFAGEGGHIAGARNIPLEELRSRLFELGGHHQRCIRLVCRTDRRSSAAAQVLAAAGFSDAHAVQGGMTAWQAKGWPTTRS